MEWSCREELRIEDGAYVRRLDDGALIAVLASGPVVPGTPSTATFIASALSVAPPDDPERALATLDVQARGDRLVAATAVLWRLGEFRIAWVGDVRGHLVRNGVLVATTRDHTLYSDLSAQGMAIPEGAGLERITSRILGGPNAAVEAWAWEVDANDILVLCAPHLHDFRPPATYLDAALDHTRACKGRLVITSHG